MQMIGAPVTEYKSISAAKPSRGSGQSRGRAAARRGAANVLWKRITASYDEEVRNFAKNPALVSPITRWVLFTHLTQSQGMAGRRYADIVKSYRYFTIPIERVSPKSANLEPTAAGEDQELEKIIFNGSLPEYEEAARYAKRQYKRLMKVLDRYADPITGRNMAKDCLDNLCLADVEPPAEYRPHIAIVLTAIAKEFGLGEKKRKV